MGFNVNILLSGGLLLCGVLIMATAAVFDMYDAAENGPIIDINPDPDEYEASRPNPGHNLFMIGAASVGIGLFVKYMKWGE